MTPTACRTPTSAKKEEAGSITGPLRVAGPSKDSRCSHRRFWSAPRPCRGCRSRFKTGGLKSDSAASPSFSDVNGLAKHLVPQWLARFESVGYALLRFLLPAERDECFSLQIEDVLLADQ